MISVSRMAKKEHISETPAPRYLRRHALGFTEHPSTEGWRSAWERP
jgi:hypothetical protein